MERIDFIMTTTEAHFLLSDRFLGLVLGISSLLKIPLQGDLLNGNSSDLSLPVVEFFIVSTKWLIEYF